MLAAPIESEIAALGARYGAPKRVSVTLEGGPFEPLTSSDRIGEVCMVLRRRNGKLLTAIKTFYPPGAFRLLTGGIDHGESIEAALLRETAEETGLEVSVRQFLAIIEYQLQDQQPGYPQLSTSIPHNFVTFAFLLDELGGTLGPQDASEQVEAFREVEVAELPAIAAALEQAPNTYHPKVSGVWRDWGRFRAVVHRVVYDALRDHAFPAASW